MATLPTTKESSSVVLCSDKPAEAFDARIIAAELYYLPIDTRVPLKFGTETLTSVTCARARVTIRRADGWEAVGWGETPLSVQWVWPSSIDHAVRHGVLKQFCERLTSDWASFTAWGHPLEIGYQYLRGRLPIVSEEFNARQPNEIQIPYLAALLCCSPFDIALHDAYGTLHNLPTYETYDRPFLRHDLSHFLNPTTADAFDFRDCYPASFMQLPRKEKLVAWHLVGGLDPLAKDELTGNEPDDGHPVLLADWITRDGLKCLKVKLRGNDADWDYERLLRVGQIARKHQVKSLTADYNCTVTDPAYVIEMLDRLERDEPDIYEMILYVEQPFPYDLEKYALDVSQLAEKKPLLMDESAHDWMHVRLGKSLGWNGVALKTCKTQTGAILTLCWAKAAGMHVMVQDLTNPMLAQIPHVLLAAHAGTMLGVESNAMQFYPAASDSEAVVHPGLYQRRSGELDLSTVRGPGFGYRVDEIGRRLPPRAATASPPES